jgi:NTE family protein
MRIEIDREKLGQIVLVLQGGGALGAYQAGVYQALHEAEIEPYWIIGTSIGAINAGLIAGNAPPIGSLGSRNSGRASRKAPLLRLPTPTRS